MNTSMGVGSSAAQPLHFLPGEGERGGCEPMGLDKVGGRAKARKERPCSDQYSALSLFFERTQDLCLAIWWGCA